MKIVFKIPSLNNKNNIKRKFGWNCNSIKQLINRINQQLLLDGNIEMKNIKKK